MAYPRVLITGGSGRLGRAIRRVLPDCIAPTHAELDILDYRQCRQYVNESLADTVIHCAGFVNAAEAERRNAECWAVNVIGTENMVQAADSQRFVYISSDYVFGGYSGNYSEIDVPTPVNYYGFTKAVAETAVRQFDGTLILRAPFRDDPPWRYACAFADQWTSCDFVSVRAPQIVRAALSDWTGVLHIGGERRSVLELARLATPDVGEMSRSDVAVPLPRDTSLDCSKWRSLLAQ